MVCTNIGGLRTIRAQHVTVQKPLLPVRRMIEANNFVGFCMYESVVLTLGHGDNERLREESGNFTMDAWLVSPMQSTTSENRAKLITCSPSTAMGSKEMYVQKGKAVGEICC